MINTTSHVSPLLSSFLFLLLILSSFTDCRVRTQRKREKEEAGRKRVSPVLSSCAHVPCSHAYRPSQETAALLAARMEAELEARVAREKKQRKSRVDVPPKASPTKKARPPSAPPVRESRAAAAQTSTQVEGPIPPTVAPRGGSRTAAQELAAKAKRRYEV